MTVLLTIVLSAITAEQAVQLAAALLGGGFLWRALMYKPDREAKMVATANVMIDQLQEDVLELRKRMDDVVKENDRLRLMVNQLSAVPARCATCPLWAHNTLTQGPQMPQAPIVPIVVQQAPPPQGGYPPQGRRSTDRPDQPDERGEQ